MCRMERAEGVGVQVDGMGSPQSLVGSQPSQANTWLISNLHVDIIGVAAEGVESSQKQ
jgi:hypothetical protein